MGWGRFAEGARTPNAGTGWAAPTLAANWSNFGGTNQVAEYMRDGTGFVHLRGLIKKSVATVAGETMLTLPAGFRPAAQEWFGTDSNNTHANIYISTNGTVNLQTGNAAWVSLSGITYKAV